MQEIKSIKRIKVGVEELDYIFAKFGVSSYRELGKVLGIEYSYLYKQLNGQKNLSYKLEKILEETL